MAGMQAREAPRPGAQMQPGMLKAPSGPSLSQEASLRSLGDTMASESVEFLKAYAQACAACAAACFCTLWLKTYCDTVLVVLM